MAFLLPPAYTRNFLELIKQNHKKTEKSIKIYYFHTSTKSSSSHVFRKNFIFGTDVNVSVYLFFLLILPFCFCCVQPWKVRVEFYERKQYFVFNFKLFHVQAVSKKHFAMTALCNITLNGWVMLPTYAFDEKLSGKWSFLMNKHLKRIWTIGYWKH